MQKINNLFNGEYVLKYQIAMEDLDFLVSVKSDEDIRHMLDEYDRLEREGNLKLRTYLFPIKPTLTENQNSFSVLGPHALDQRFVDAINGINRPLNFNPKPMTNNYSIKSFSPSPTEGSPPQSISPRNSTSHNPFIHQENSLIHNLHNKFVRMHKVQSSPNLFTNSNYCSTQYHNHCHHVYKSPNSVHHDDQIHSHQEYHSPMQQQESHNFSYQGYKATSINPKDNHRYPSPQYLVAKNDYVNFPFTHKTSHHNKPFIRDHPGSGGRNRWGHLDQCASSSYRRS
ncbi:hypothetical protein BVRB_6g143430 isoform B [Beta vulgaris subsp. vulgaris]|nr:hypothetical protein BVRB_6g143430 isoform B [Beta vulgaris subsp. vulgaris]